MEGGEGGRDGEGWRKEGGEMRDGEGQRKEGWGGMEGVWSGVE